MSQVFLSYRRVEPDQGLAEALCSYLEERGLRVFIDKRIQVGRIWVEEIDRQLQASNAFVVLLSESSVRSDMVRQEVQTAYELRNEGKMTILPVRVGFEGKLPYDLASYLNTIQYILWRPGEPTEELFSQIQAAITSSVPLPTEPIPGQPPHGPKMHNLPFLPLGDLFKGRDEELRALQANFRGSTGAAGMVQIQVIHGLGGMGKTRLAVEYAWRSGDRYEAALFVVADSPEALRSGLAERLDTVSGTEVATIFSWIRTHDRWLVILDNIDDEETARAARKLLPQLQAGHVLITSRRRNWPAGLKNRALKELSLKEATQFLLQRTEEARAATEGDPEQARQLARYLDGLPLALEQAAAYICHHQITFSKYLEIWERESVLGWYDGDLMEYPASIAGTWQTTFRQLRPTAAALLRLAAYLAPEPLPLEMFEKGRALVTAAVQLLRDEIGPANNDDSQPVQEGISELAAFSMVAREAGTFTVHRMVQEVLRTRICEPHRRDWIELALRLVNDYSPADADEVRTWPMWDLLWPHAAEVSRYADEMQIASPTSGLMRRVSVYLSAKGLYAEAEPLIRRSLAIEEAIDPNSSEVAVRLNNLPRLLQATNRLGGSRALDAPGVEDRRRLFRTGSPQHRHRPHQSGSPAEGHEPVGGSRAFDAQGLEDRRSLPWDRITRKSPPISTIWLSCSRRRIDWRRPSR